MKHTKHNKHRNNIRKIEKPKTRKEFERRAFLRTINLIGKLDTKNELDFLN